MVGLFLTGRIVPSATHDKLQRENEELRAEIRDLNKTFLDQVIPALVRSTDVLSQHTVDQERGRNRDDMVARPPRAPGRRKANES